MKHCIAWLLAALAFAMHGASALAADPNYGASVYASTCATCHGANPTANYYNIMNGANNAALIEYMIANTYPMQPLSDLPTADIDAVAAYLESLANPAGVTPQTGYWWNTLEGGRGFTIEQNPSSGNVFVSTYLYSADGTPVWYAAGPAPMNGRTFSAPLAAFGGGQTLNGAWQAATAGASPGTLSITFTDPTDGALTWPGGTIPITRFSIVPGGLGSPPTATQPQSGYWWNPAESGRGYTVEVQDSTVFIAAYMYDASGNPVWYASGPAALTGDNTYQGTLLEYTGGQTLTGTYQAPSGTSSMGDITVQFTSATTGMLTLPDGEQVPIQRFAF
jgi:cytochrome c553